MLPKIQIKCLDIMYLKLSANCRRLCLPMRVEDEFAGSVMRGETNNMLE